MGKEVGIFDAEPCQNIGESVRSAIPVRVGKKRDVVPILT